MMNEPLLGWNQAPMTSLIDVDQLRSFIAIVETGSFTRAADMVNKTQSAVSMQIKRLETRLERPIFARDGRASKLTEDGERLLDYARRIVKLNIEALAAFSATALSGRGLVFRTTMRIVICRTSWRGSRGFFQASKSRWCANRASTYLPALTP